MTLGQNVLKAPMNIDTFLERLGIELLQRVDLSMTVVLLLTTGVGNQLSWALAQRSTYSYMDRESETTMYTWAKAVSLQSHTRICRSFTVPVTSPLQGVVVVGFMCWSETALVPWM
jgi:hypothetical protein